MKTIGRPRKPETQKRQSLTVTVSYRNSQGIREYAAANAVELSATVDQAIQEFLLRHSTAAVAPVAPVADLAPAPASVPAVPVVKATRTPRKLKPISGIARKTYERILQKIEEWNQTKGIPITSSLLFEMAGISSGGGSKYIKQAVRDGILKKNSNGIYKIMAENLPTASHTSSPTPSSLLPR